MQNPKTDWLPLNYFFRAACLGLAGATIAELVWMRDAGLFLLLALFPLYGLGKNKIGYASLWIWYYLSGSRGVITAVEGYYPDLAFSTAFGVFLWLLSATTLALPWLFLHPKSTDTIWRWAGKFTLSIALITLPPIGLWGWLFPALFMAQVAPGGGIQSLVIGLMLAMILIRVGQKSTVQGILSVLCIALLTMLLNPLPVLKQPYDVFASDTQLGGWPKDNQEMTRRQIDLLNLMMDLDDQLPKEVRHVILPEGVAGPWVKGMDQFWGVYGKELAKRSGRNYYFGSEIPYDDTKRQGALVAITPHGIFEQAIAMQPMPVSSWHPWKNGGTVTSWGETNVVQLGKSDYAFLFCYEELMVIPVIKQFVYFKPQAIIAIANAWWSAKSGAADMQERHTKAWAALFGVPYLRSTNR